MLLERPKSNCVPDMTKTGLLSSICIKFSFSERKITKTAPKTPESLVGFPTAFEDCLGLTDICTCSASVITDRAPGLGMVEG